MKNSDNIIEISQLDKVYDGGFKALKNINLNIKKGEIFALLGPNGAGKTTMISIICGIANPTAGKVLVSNHDIISDYKKTRSLIGLVPQELNTDAFESVWSTVCFSRGLFGKKPNPTYIKQLLKNLSLWDKKDNRMMTLSGGMKRRVMIAKALSHEPQVLFLDEPTAGVDVELRKDMWRQVRNLREAGVTIILTTHYIEEAEEMADRIGVISNGQLILVEEKEELMKKMGSKKLTIELQQPLSSLPDSMNRFDVQVDQQTLTYTFDSQKQDSGICTFLEELVKNNIRFNDINTKKSSLEEIFVALVNQS